MPKHSYVNIYITWNLKFIVIEAVKRGDNYIEWKYYLWQCPDISETVDIAYNARGAIILFYGNLSNGQLFNLAQFDVQESRYYLEFIVSDAVDI